MSRSTSPSASDIAAAAEVVYAILNNNNIRACVIGSTAIACSTKMWFGRNPNSVDFVIFEQGHNRRILNNLLLASNPESFLEEKPPGSQSRTLPPLLYYLPTDPLIKRIRIFFLPWTRQVSQVIPSLDTNTLVTAPPIAIPVPSIPYILYMQLHGWVWNDTILRKNPTNNRAHTKRSHFANDVIFLLPLAANSNTQFQGLSETFMKNLQDNVNKFIRAHPEAYKHWAAMGVEVEPEEATALQAVDELDTGWGLFLDHISNATMVRPTGPSYSYSPETPGSSAAEDTVPGITPSFFARRPSAHYLSADSTSPRIYDYSEAVLHPENSRRPLHPRPSKGRGIRSIFSFILYAIIGYLTLRVALFCSLAIASSLFQIAVNLFRILLQILWIKVVMMIWWFAFACILTILSLLN